MRKTLFILSTIILAFIFNAGSINAQPKNTGENFFIGKWNAMLYGVPDGDTKMVINIDKKDDKLTGNMADPAKSDPPIELENIEVADSTFKAIFSAQGMDITIMLKIKNDTSITGSMMNMFDIKGTKAN
ncbi:MAG: hypothetical protein WA816_12385 [Bacteroidales bacterium]